MRRTFGFFFPSLLTIGSALATEAATPELSQRIYSVEGRPMEVVVLREMRASREDGSLDGFRLYRTYRDRDVVTTRLERFGQWEKKAADRPAIAVEFLKEENGPEAARAINGIDRLFAEAFGSLQQARLRARALGALAAHRPIPVADSTSSFTYVYRTAPGSSGSDATGALDAGSSAWREESRAAAQERENENRARKDVLNQQGRLSVGLTQEFRDWTERTAASAQVAMEDTRRFLAPADLTRAPVLIEREHQLNEPAQARVRQAADSAARREDWAAAAKRVADLESPTLTTSSPATGVWLRESAAVDSLRHAPFFDRGALPVFRSAPLESEKLVVANLIQAAALARPALSEGRGRVWLRASAMLVHAAGAAEIRDPARAALLLREARIIASTLAGGGDGVGLSLVHEGDRREFRLDPQAAPLMEAVESTAEDDVFATALDVLSRETGVDDSERSIFDGETPSAHVARLALRTAIKLAGKVDDPHLKAGEYFMKIAMKARGEEATLGREAALLHATALAAFDLAVGFIPPLAALKGLYEFSSGRHWITGKPLDNLDRGFALLTVLSLGSASTFVKAFEAIGRITPYSTEARLIVAFAREGARDLMATGLKFAPSVLESMRRTLPAVASTEEALTLLRTRALEIGGQVRALPRGSEILRAEGRVVEARLTQNSLRGALIALPAAALGRRVIAEASRVDGAAWTDVRTELDLPPPPPTRVTNIELRRGDRVRSETVDTAAGPRTRLELVGPELARTIGSERTVMVGDDGRIRLGAP